MPNTAKVSKTRRAVATLIDLVVVFFILTLVTGVYLALRYALFGNETVQAIETFLNPVDKTSPESLSPDDGYGAHLSWPPNPPVGVSDSTYLLYQLLHWCMEIGWLVAVWLYFSKMESSPRKATPGKRLAGLQIVNYAGERISALRATLRFIVSLLRVAVISFLVFIPTLTIASVISPSTQFFDYCFSVGAGAALLLICVHSGKHGQRLQDVLTRTMVVSGNWQPDVIDAYSAQSNSKAGDNSSGALFRFIHLSLWAAVFIVPAYAIYYPTNMPPAKTIQTRDQSAKNQRQPSIDEKEKPMKNYSPLVGWLVGTCTNTSMGGTANLMLTIYGATNATVHGDLALFGELGGGGAFGGKIDNDQITFTTTVPDAQIAITWQGMIQGSRLSGTYVVRCDDPDVEASLRHQEGVWSCNLVRLMGPPNPDEANTVWVYHDGNEDGPFTTEAFTQRLNTGQWPPNAIVALHDRTTWSTTAACLAKIKAEAASRN